MTSLLSCKKRLYTLIELMVTISIIAILISLLLTALAKGREVVERSACMDNMKGIAAATFQLTGDNQGLAPMNVDDEPGALGPAMIRGWSEQLAAYAGIDLPEDMVISGENYKFADGYTADTAGIFLCPSSTVANSGAKVVMSYKIHRSSGIWHGTIGERTPWHNATLRGISSDTWFWDEKPSQARKGWAAKLGLVPNASSSLAFAEWHEEDFLFGSTNSDMTLKRYGWHIGPGGDQFNSDFSIEDAWPHGFGMMSYMLVDGHVEHKYIGETVDDNSRDVWTEDREYFAWSTKESNGVWDCFGARPHN